MILIVDDQQSMCWILSKVLSETGFSVETVETAEEALSTVDDEKVSVAVIDYRLPDMNGFQLFSELRERDSDIKAILITSYGSKKLKEEALNLGFYSYFDKPFDNHILVRSIISALEDLKQPREKKASEREYDIPRKWEESFRIVFETVPIAAVLADAKGKTVQTNRAAQEIFGYTEKEFQGKTLTDLLQLNDSDECSELSYGKSPRLPLPKILSWGISEVIRHCLGFNVRNSVSEPSSTYYNLRTTDSF